MPDTLQLQIVDYHHTVDFDAGGRSVKMLKVDFKLGMFGPFFFREPDDADVQTKLRNYIEAKLNELRALQGSY